MRMWLCGSVLALLAAACGERASRFTVGVQGNTDVLRPALTVAATGPHFRHTWKGPEITSSSAPNYAPVVETPSVGKLRVEAALSVPGSAASTALIELDMRPDWHWQVDIWLKGHNPLAECFGCIGAKAFPVPDALQRTGHDSLYVVWGGNSIRHPVEF